MADAATTMAQMLAGMSKENLLALMQQMAAIVGAQPPLPQQPAAPIATPQPVVAPVQTQQPAAQPVKSAFTRAQLCDSVAAETIAGWLSKGGLPPISQAVAEMALYIKMAIESRNTGLSQREARMRVPEQIPESAVARYLVASGNVAMLRLDSESSTYRLGVRKDRESIWEIVMSPLKGRNSLRRLISVANPEAGKSYLENVIRLIEDTAPARDVTHDGMLIPCRNGVVDVRTGELIPYADCADKYTFIYRLRVNYNPQAQNVVIHNDSDNTDWDVESWIREIAKYDEIADVLWDVIGASLRPYWRWNKCVIVWAQSGKNGKGTLLEMIRQMYDGGVESIPIGDFDKKFLLQNIASTQLILCDENDDNGYVEKSKNFKAAVTGDVVSSDVKYSDPINVHWGGFMVQCMNDLLRFKTKSQSLMHRLLIVPFCNSFQGNAERKYIKDDYVLRPAVQEYVLKKVVEMGPYTSLYESPMCKEALGEFRETNDPVYYFMNEIADQLRWDLVPYTFLHALYVGWYNANGGSSEIGGGIPSPKTMTTRVNAWIDQHQDEWLRPMKSEQIRRSNLMDRPEPLIQKYNVNDWKNPVYRGNDLDRVCSPMLESRYCGIFRRSAWDEGRIELKARKAENPVDLSLYPAIHAADSDNN